MSKPPSQILHELFAALDHKDGDSILSLMSADIVMVDEISRRWLRGKDAVAAQIRAVLAATDSVQSRLSDLQMQPLGPEALLATGWLDQTYILNGHGQTITAPLSACLQAQAGTWMVTSLHAIPLTEARH